MDTKRQIAALKGAETRLTPDVIRDRAKCVRLHTEQNMGINAIAPRVGRNKCVVRKWLIRAGIYATGGRSTRPVGYLERLATKLIIEGYRAEQKALAKTDEDRHWGFLCGASASNRAKAMAYYYANHETSKAAGRRAGLKRWHNRKGDSAYRLRKYLGTRIYGALKRRGKQHRKTCGTVKMLGCSIPELITHLESQFNRGMEWGNYGQWHVDHIRPCASFDLSQPEQQLACFNWRNLQPLWGRDNISKGDSWAG